MIEDYITDMLEEYGHMHVSLLIDLVSKDLDCTTDEVEDAIINLENQGRVQGCKDNAGLALIKLYKGAEE